MRTTLLGSLLMLTLSAGLESSARAQMCPPVPPDFRPTVVAHPEATLLDGNTWTVRVHFRHVHCSTSRAPIPRVRARDVRVEVVRGPSPGSVLSARDAGDSLRVRMPGPGSYRVRIRSLEFPSLDAATHDVQVVDPAHAVPVTFRLVPSPRLGAEPRLGAVTVVRMGTYASAPRRPSRANGRVRVPSMRLEPGTYEIRHGGPWGMRTATIDVVAEGEREVVFPGSRVRVVIDWLPADGAMYEVLLDRPSGEAIPLRAVLGPTGATVGEDVMPGEAILRVRSTPRHDPWDALDPSLVWTEIASERVDVPAQSELVRGWSMPNVLARHAMTRGPWTELPDLGSEPTDASPPTNEHAWAVSLQGGAAAYVGARVHVFDGAWHALAPAPTMRRGLSASLRVDGTGTRVPDGARFAISAIASSSFAWIEGGEFVSYRTPAGLSQELLPLYDASRPYPCYTTGIAAVSERDVVVVGHCRPNAPESDRTVEHEGFLATRDAEGWTLRPERPRPLRAIVRDGDRLVAVGDGGTVVVRERGAFTITRRGDHDYVDVSSHAGRVVARTVAGRLVEIPRPDDSAAVVLPAYRDVDVERAVTEHCVTARGVVVRIAEQRGEAAVHPERILRLEGGSYVAIERPASPASHRLVCESGVASLVTRAPGGMRVESLAP